jgi:hypothetical protein
LTNRTRFDPFDAEIESLPEHLKVTAEVSRGDGRICVHERALSSQFVSPCGPDDIVQVLMDVPLEFLKGLRAIVLLAGTLKQIKARRLRFGAYELGRIFLHPLPERRLRTVWKPPPKASVRKEYTRFGAEFRDEGGSAVLRFTELSLRSFYLYDVLLHEIGHHYNRERRSVSASERYARWFAEYQSSKLRKGGDGGAG